MEEEGGGGKEARKGVVGQKEKQLYLDFNARTTPKVSNGRKMIQQNRDSVQSVVWRMDRLSFQARRAEDSRP